MLEKKGAAHFEMIISFVFFVTFIFFLFVFLKPYSTATISGAVVTGLYDSLDKQVRTELTNLFVEVGNYSNNPNDCFYVDFEERIFTYALTQSIVKTVEDVKVNSDAGVSNLKINNSLNNRSYYKVAISPVFLDENLSGCFNVSDYNHGDILERRVWSYNSLQAVSLRYKTDYDGLREDMKIPETFDFAVVSEDLPELNMESIIPDSGDVIANQYILEVLYSNGDVVIAEFTLKVW